MKLGKEADGNLSHKDRVTMAGGPVKGNRLTHREPLWERLVINHPVKTGIQIMNRELSVSLFISNTGKFCQNDRNSGQNGLRVKGGS